MLDEGWVGEEALAIAIYSCLVGSDFKGTMRNAANQRRRQRLHGPDRGQPHGAPRGLESILRPWIEPLGVFEAAYEVAQPTAAAG